MQPPLAGKSLVVIGGTTGLGLSAADPRELFVPECARLGQPQRVLRAGEAWRSPLCR